jgi:hypothetical protein
MKKVRLAIGIGAVGTAAPALGMMAAPAAHAASPPGAHAATPFVRTHFYGTHRATSATPDVQCGVTFSGSRFSPNGELYGGILYGGWNAAGSGCVAFQLARLDKRQTGLAERIRFRSLNGSLKLQKFIAGTISGSATYWNSYPNYYAHQVCEALVANGNHNNVVYGPVCEST